MEKPKSIKNLEYLVIASCLIQVFVMTKSIDAKLISDGMAWFGFIFGTGLFFALPAYLALRKKSNLAKWILIISIIIGFFLSMTQFNNMVTKNPNAMPYEIISSCLELAILYCLFTDESKNWFNKIISATSTKFEGKRDLSNEAYRIFLVKKYEIEKNDALGKIIFEDRLFDNIEDALESANQKELALVKTDEYSF
jgi:hypothetical protein